MFPTRRYTKGARKPHSSGGRHRDSAQPGCQVILTTVPPALDGAVVDRIFAAGMRPTATNPELEAIRARLRAVEARDRWLVAAMAALLVALLAGAGVWLAGQVPSHDEGVEGQRFSLRDAAGQERAWLGMDNGQPVLRFLDARGQERAGLELGDTGLTVRVVGARGQLQTGLSLEKQGVALISFDEGGRPVTGPDAVTNRIGSFVPARGERATR
jgi:hypothetical protein